MLNINSNTMKNKKDSTTETPRAPRIEGNIKTVKYIPFTKEKFFAFSVHSVSRW